MLNAQATYGSLVVLYMNEPNRDQLKFMLHFKYVYNVLLQNTYADVSHFKSNRKKQKCY